MSKIFVNPSAIRSGLADLEMAEETVGLINQNIEDNQAHLQGVPIDVEALPEEVQRLHITEPRQKQQIKQSLPQDDEEEEDFYMTESTDHYAPLQSYLESVGAQIVKRMKAGEGFSRAWSKATDDIISYVSTNYMISSTKSTETKFTQTPVEKPPPVPPTPVPKPKKGPLREVEDPRDSSGPQGLDWSSSNDEDDASIEAEIAHQIAESFSKKYKFPSRSSGIFLWNFEQLKMNLDDIVKEVKGIPGVLRLAKDGAKLPLRCMLGGVASTHSKRFQILVNSPKLGKLMQDDLNKYLAY
ncbi:phosphoprotein [Taiwan bat lyssavirus 1]|nr:phosphoprotein [Taiwan bat lyssavirus 1]